MDNQLHRMVLKFIVLGLILIGMPMLGTLFSDQALDQYLEFPPRTRFISHSPFSWIGFGLIGSLTAMVMIPFLIVGLRRRPPCIRMTFAGRPFPWWGWAAAGSLAIFWVLAWTRFSFFASFQGHTFTPLWLSFIVTVNAWNYHRTGRCLLMDKTGYFLLLFPASAGFWWFFEYLNRFVQNWYYPGVTFSPGAYLVHASLAFATVLPAVLSMAEAVRSCCWIERFRRLPRVPIASARLGAILFMTVGAAGLLGISAAPNYLFPLLWLAPLWVLLSLEFLAPRSGLLQPLLQGDWREAVAAMLAALICGFFWEMWNFFSDAKWVYSIPWVHRFKVFEMPLLGYAGYLPFGLECLAVAGMLNMHIPSISKSEETQRINRQG